MQPVQWYFRRLKTMSPAEIVWRLKSEIRDLFDHIRFRLGLFPDFNHTLNEKDYLKHQPGFNVSDLALGIWQTSEKPTEIAAWHQKLITQADLLLGHKFNFFNLQNKDLGSPIIWNYDHGSDKATPMAFWTKVDYRNFKQSGDCKLVWEPNRHHQLVILARAYRATGDIRYADEVMAQLVSWLDQNPFGCGMNWRSPLELGVRLINWVWALDLIKDSGLFAGKVRHRLMNAIYLHCWEITRKYSQGSSANNHLVGEAAGVFVAASYFTELPNMAVWASQSKEILQEQLFAQTFADGCTREHALGYEFFVIQFYLICGLVGQWTGQTYSEAYWTRLEKMFEFVALLDEGGAELPMFGDRDNGYVLDLGNRAEDVKALMSVAAVIFKRSDFKSNAGVYAEMAQWLLGSQGRDTFGAIVTDNKSKLLRSHAFAESGYYLLQSGNVDQQDAISVFIDCTELGYGAIAAHGHADALSFALRYGGTDVFVDPGTYDYFTYPEWRNYFRTTRAHNTVEIDGQDQSEMLGPFLWGKRAETRCLEWDGTDGGGRLVGEHNGYSRLADPVIHRRHFHLDGANRCLTIIDEIDARQTHQVCIAFQLSEYCTISSVKDQSCLINVNGQPLRLELDPELRLETATGQEQPIAGWLSRGYHQKVAITTLFAKGQSTGKSSYRTRILFPDIIK